MWRRGSFRCCTTRVYGRTGGLEKNMFDKALPGDHAPAAARYFARVSERAYFYAAFRIFQPCTSVN